MPSLERTDSDMNSDDDIKSQDGSTGEFDYDPASWTTPPPSPPLKQLKSNTVDLTLSSSDDDDDDDECVDVANRAYEWTLGSNSEKETTKADGTKLSPPAPSRRILHTQPRRFLQKKNTVDASTTTTTTAALSTETTKAAATGSKSSLSAFPLLVHHDVSKMKGDVANAKPPPTNNEDDDTNAKPPAINMYGDDCCYLNMDNIKSASKTMTKSPFLDSDDDDDEDKEDDEMDGILSQGPTFNKSTPTNNETTVAAAAKAKPVPVTKNVFESLSCTNNNFVTLSTRELQERVNQSLLLGLQNRERTKLMEEELRSRRVMTITKSPICQGFSTSNDNTLHKMNETNGTTSSKINDAALIHTSRLCQGFSAAAKDDTLQGKVCGGTNEESKVSGDDLNGPASSTNDDDDALMGREQKKPSVVTDIIVHDNPIGVHPSAAAAAADSNVMLMDEGGATKETDNEDTKMAVDRDTTEVETKEATASTNLFKDVEGKKTTEAGRGSNPAPMFIETSESQADRVSTERRKHLIKRFGSFLKRKADVLYSTAASSLRKSSTNEDPSTVSTKDASADSSSNPSSDTMEVTDVVYEYDPAIDTPTENVEMKDTPVDDESTTRPLKKAKTTPSKKDCDDQSKSSEEYDNRMEVDATVDEESVPTEEAANEPVEHFTSNAANSGDVLDIAPPTGTAVQSRNVPISVEHGGLQETINTYVTDEIVTGNNMSGGTNDGHPIDGQKDGLDVDHDHTLETLDEGLNINVPTNPVLDGTLRENIQDEVVDGLQPPTVENEDVSPQSDVQNEVTDGVESDLQEDANDLKSNVGDDIIDDTWTVVDWDEDPPAVDEATSSYGFEVSFEKIGIVSLPLFILSVILWKMGLQSMSISTITTVGKAGIQLGLSSLLVVWIFRFGEKSRLATFGYCLLMIIAAADDASRRITHSYSGQFYVILASLLVNMAWITMFASSIILEPKAIWNPYYVLPVAGLMLVNSMGGLILSLDSMNTSIVNSQSTGPLDPSLDLSNYDEMSHIWLTAIEEGAKPVLNMMGVIRLPVLPVITCSLVLGGLSVDAAAKCTAIVTLLSITFALSTIMTATSASMFFCCE